jgi:hypothetical protein
MDNNQQQGMQFNMNNNVTRNTFPSLVELQDILYDMDFNNILNMVKNRILMEKSNGNNYARFMNVDFMNIKPQIVNDVKLYLRNEKNYTITDIEDVAGVHIGWKITY